MVKLCLFKKWLSGGAETKSKLKIQTNKKILQQTRKKNGK